MPEKCALNILELNWSQPLGQDKIEHSSSYAHVCLLYTSDAADE